MLLFDMDIECKSTVQSIKNNLHIDPGPRWPDKFGKALYEWCRDDICKPIQTLSLFSGAGGLDIGFHDAGFKVHTLIEIEEKFVKTLEYNSNKGSYYENAEIKCIDIRDYLPSQEFSIDFIIGGPPCQTFSAAGRRAAGVNGTSDERGMLFEEYARLLKYFRPIGFLFENVYGITGAEKGKAWEKIQRSFREVGYEIEHRILDAADYGVPQHRERLFIVGYRDSAYKFPKPTHGPDSPGNENFISAALALEDLKQDDEKLHIGINGRYGKLLNEIPPGLNYSFFTEKMGHPQPIFAWRSKFSDFLYKADPNAPVRTIKAQGGQYTGPFHWDNRPFTVEELKRLQTFPDDYKIIGNRQSSIQQIGNSVPPQLARILACSILTQLFDIRLPFNLPLLEPTEELNFRKRKRLLTNVYKKKAQRAISKIQTSDKTYFRESRMYYGCLDESFKWTRSNSKNENAYKTQAQFNDQALLVTISQESNINPAFEIILSPRQLHSWNMPFKTVRLIGYEYDFSIFQALWKALDYELSSRDLKADIVQLCGYYQYQPSFHCVLSFSKNMRKKKWQILKHVVEGKCTREILSGKELAHMWNVKENKVLSYCAFLKSLGYEVRNNNTNMQIKKGYYLIPYSFPSLTHMSVQLRKSLEGNN